MPRYAKKRSATEEAPAPAKPLKRSRDEEDSDQSSDDEKSLTAKEYLDDEAQEASGDDESGGESESSDVSEDDSAATEPDSDSGTDSDPDGSRFKTMSEADQAVWEKRQIERLRSRYSHKY